MKLTIKHRFENLIFMKICSFISSMFPFSFYLTLKYWNEYTLVFGIIPQNIIANSIFVIEIISILYLVNFFKYEIKNGNFNKETNYHLKEIKQEKTSTSSYLLSNVLPVVTLEIDKMYSVIFLVSLIFLLAFMYIKNNLYFINPLYDILGIKVYQGNIFQDKVQNKNIQYVISVGSIYDFNDNMYEGVAHKDTLFITKKIQ